jgi:hypothetical protein
MWAVVALLLATPLASCGVDPGEPGGLEGQVLGMTSPTEQPVLLEGAVVALSGPGGTQAQTTDRNGAYRFADLRPGTYGFAASYQGPRATGRPLQAEERQFTVSPGQDETISVVLLADDITPPATPPPAPAAGTAGSQGATSAGGGPNLLADPFFWYFLFNQPRGYGYDRPPVVLPPTAGRGPVTIDTNQPTRSPAGRPYTRYDDSATGVNTKPPPTVTSKGTTRPGASGTSGSSGGPAARPPSSSGSSTSRPATSGGGSPSVKPPAAKPPSSSPSNSGSKGTTRPGASSGSGSSVKPPTSKPPAVRPPSRRGR